MKMWDGRFKKPTGRLMEAFNNSLSFDKALIEEDIEGSIAWADALCLRRGSERKRTLDYHGGTSWHSCRL